jgi:hypothetical protein
MLTEQDLTNLEAMIERILDKKLDQRFKEFEEKLDKKIDYLIDQKLDQKLNEKFDEKLKPIYTELNIINNKLNDLTDIVVYTANYINDKIDPYIRKIPIHENQIASLNNRVDRLENQK